MKAFRLSDDARAAVDFAVEAATSVKPMTRAEEVKALMAKGMKIAIARGHAVWAFVPTKIALAVGIPYIAALPAGPDMVDYMSAGGEFVTIP